MERVNMEWVTDIFEESVSKDSLHAFCGIHEEHPSHHTTPSTSMELEDNGSDIYNNEDVDRAIAISLSEEIQRKEIEKEAQLKEDELLARAIQQSLNFEGSSEGETEHDSPEFEDCHSNHEGDEIEDCHSTHEGDEIEDSIPPVEIEEIKDSVPAVEIKDSVPAEEWREKKVRAEEIEKIKGSVQAEDWPKKKVRAEEIEKIEVSVPAEDWRKKKVRAEEIEKIKGSVPAEDWRKKKVRAEEIEKIEGSVPAEDWRKKKVRGEEIEKIKGSVPAEDWRKKKVPAEEIEKIKDPVPPVEIEVNPRRNHQNVYPPEEIEINLRRNHQNVDQRSYYSNDMECDVCYYYIPKNRNGHLEYRSHPFWLQKYCTSHEHDGTPRCCSCERMKSYDSIFIGLDDGRKLCLECHDSAIMDTDGCQPLYLEIKKFYEGLGMKLEQQVPILLVEREALNEAREGEKDGHHNMPETRGICLSEEQSSRQVPRRPKTKGGQSSDDSIEKEPQKLRRHCEVTAILILHGLPRLLTGTILTHELMHAWLRLQGYPTLCPEVEEGICQVMALMWLEIELRRESVDFTTDKKFGEFLKQSIVSDSSPAYGDGFRAGWQAARKFGLQRTLDHIRKTGKFPI